MPPRRSHKKSRAGCKRCKTRKIKCDEVHPRCGNCLRHGVVCDFEQPEVIRGLQGQGASPSSGGFSSAPLDEASARRPSYMPATPQSSPAAAAPLIAQPGDTVPLTGSHPVSRLTELRLMHHYTKYTHKTLAITSPQLTDLWGVSVPELAFGGNQHLMDGILALAALHLRSFCPTDKEVIQASHSYMISCVNQYSKGLSAGINANNAATLFLTATLIAFQSTASRVFTKDESHFGLSNLCNYSGWDVSGMGNVYQPPLSWFHSFQGVKTIVAASWPWLKHSETIVSIIDAQPVMNLDFKHAADGFFGHLLQGLDDELASAEASPAASSDAASPPSAPSPGSNSSDFVKTTRQAYQHAVATLNWAHSKPGKGALAFPATVSKRFVEMVEERKPRALAILASFFALLKVLDQVWWLQGMARREVLGIVSLFNSDFFGAETERRWWPHMEWAVRVALYDPGQSGNQIIPAEVWGSSWAYEDGSGDAKFTNHIDILSELTNPASPVPRPPQAEKTPGQREQPGWPVSPPDGRQSRPIKSSYVSSH